MFWCFEKNITFFVKVLCFNGLEQALRRQDRVGTGLEQALRSQDRIGTGLEQAYRSQDRIETGKVLILFQSCPGF